MDRNSNCGFDEPRTILIIDGERRFRDCLADQFMSIGFMAWGACDEKAAERVIEERTPILIVCDDNLHRPWIRVIHKVVDCGLTTPVVIATQMGSVSSAVRAAKLGAAGYYEKPVCGIAILETLGLLSHDASVGARIPHDAGVAYSSLDRIRWEYLNHVLDATGSLAKAAKQLRIDRRSLRRMLNKFPPTR